MFIWLYVWLFICYIMLYMSLKYLNISNIWNMLGGLVDLYIYMFYPHEVVSLELVFSDKKEENRIFTMKYDGVM